ncbi:MAG: GGDEF domain-containing protein [Pseudomonadota bacterium]|nr:GGDEF domain-containing protein [Pseudomonadota bacterium]
MSPATVIIAVMSAHLLCFGILIFAMARRLPQVNGLDEIGWCATLLGLSYILQLIGDSLDLGIASITDHTLATMGVVLFLVSLRRFFGAPRTRTSMLLGGALVYTLIQLAAHASGFPGGRNALLSATAAVLFALICLKALQAARGDGYELRILLRLLAAACGGFALLHVLKLGYIMRDGQAALALTRWHQLLFYAYMSVMAVMLMPMVIWMIFYRLTSELQAMVVHDPLTGTLNRRGMLERLGNHLATRGTRGATLLLLDLDHFKRINDSHGHLIGDEVLRHVAHQLTTGIREGDFVARTGGEEFIVGCLDATPQQAASLAERLRQRVADIRIPLPEGTPLHLTISIGVSLPLHDIRELDRAQQEADTALYAGKQAGRNRVVVAKTVAG